MESRPEPRAIESYRDESSIFNSVRYFTTCSVGALSTRVEQSVLRFLSQWHTHGVSAWDGPWWQTLGEVRERCARVLGAGVPGS